MATKRAIDAKQPNIAGAWGIHTVFSFHKLFLCKTYMHYDAISHTHDLKKKGRWYQFIPKEHDALTRILITGFRHDCPVAVITLNRPLPGQNKNTTNHDACA